MPHEILQDIDDSPSTLNADLARTKRDLEQKNKDLPSLKQSNSLDLGGDRPSRKHHSMQEIDDLPRWQRHDSLDLGSDNASTNQYPELDINEKRGWSDSLNPDDDRARINRSPLQDHSDFLNVHPVYALDLSGLRRSSGIPRVARGLMQGIGGFASWEPIDCNDLTKADQARMKEQYNFITSNLSSRSSREAGAMNRGVEVTQEIGNDSTFPDNPERERQYVRRMYDAILDMQHCEDNEGMQKSWRKVMKDEGKVERLAWEMMVCFYQNARYSTRGTDLIGLQSLCKNRHTFGPFAKTKRFFDKFDSFADRFSHVVQGMKVCQCSWIRLYLQRSC